MTPLQISDLPPPVSYDKGDKLPYSHWGQLEEGRYVMVQREGEPLLAGEVDVRTTDASVFWVWLDGGRGRIAVYPHESTSVWLPSGDRQGVMEEIAGEPAQTKR